MEMDENARAAVETPPVCAPLQVGVRRVSSRQHFFCLPE